MWVLMACFLQWRGRRAIWWVSHFLPSVFMDSFQIYQMPFFPRVLVIWHLKAILCELGKSLGTRMRNELKEKLISN